MPEKQFAAENSVAPTEGAAPIHLLIVDDDEEILAALESFFEMEGYDVTVAADGERALELLGKQPGYDLVLLDVLLPKKDGFEVLRESQEMGSSSPVLMMSGRGRQEDILHGFGLGAQDYIVKPFNAEELVARIKAILGRTMAPSEAPMRVVRVGDVELNFSTYQAHRDGEPIAFSELEFDLLRCLAQYRGNVVTRKQLLQAAWSIDQDMIAYTIDLDVVSRTVDDHITAIRRKIEPDPESPRYLETVYGLGYRFNAGSPPD
jgi:DNA-binding response OmpR family regulator